jgi:hypothetical protein
MMKAANLGASRVPGALTMGMGISLPFETSMNAYVTKGLVRAALYERHHWAF